MSLSEDINAKQLKELFAKRSSVKGRLTKFKKYLDMICSSKLSKTQVKELEININKLRVMSGQFDELQGQIEVINCDNMDTEIDERDEIEQVFSSHLAIAEEQLDKYKNALDNHDLHNVSQCHHDQSSHCHHQLQFKLPQIQISKFDGAYFRWLEFRDTYLSLIHSNKSIKPIHKFHYLVSYLEGDAARVISNLEISEANYEGAWKLLCDRYNNKRQLINYHLNSLLNINTKQQQTRESDKSLRFLVDHVNKNLRALSNLGQPTEHWDLLVIHILIPKLDNHTVMKWEELRNNLPDEVPTLNDFNKFLTDRADVLETLRNNKIDNPSVTQLHHNNNNYRTSKTFSVQNTGYVARQCVVCKGDHWIYDCPTFLAKSIQDRKTEAFNLHLCLNCLRLGHSTRECKLGPCRQCKRRHNTLLHLPDNYISNASNASTASTNNTHSDHDSSTAAEISVNNAVSNNFAESHVLLSTALVTIVNTQTNEQVQARALLDCGSQSSFISESLMNKLSLQAHPTNTINIIGIGNNLAEHVHKGCIAKLNSLDNNFSVIQSFYVMKQLTGTIPARSIDITHLNIPIHIKLADPNFHKPSTIDILIGADLFWDLLGCDQLALGPNMPKLRSSRLGWLIAGPILSYSRNHSSPINTQCHVATSDECDSDINSQLAKFWELEQVPDKPYHNKLDKECQDHFYRNTYRLNSGKFCVRLPLIDTPDCLGDSYAMGKKRFLYLEKIFRKNSELKSQYVQFIQEYFELGHLEECPAVGPIPSYYLCHHAVFKQHSETTKTRVVFDGSAKTSSGFSLNDLLMIGPNVQDSIFSILLRARQYKYILTADIEKFFRMVEIDQRDRNLQLILWRNDESEAIKTLRLKTVTYGLASATYLSTKCLSVLAKECDDQFISNIIQHDHYVDDLVTGSDDQSELLYIQRKVSDTLKSGGFRLRKFKSNLPSILSSTVIDHNDNISLSESANTLGLNWNPNTDKLQISIQVPHKGNVITKRSILSTSLKIFDPLGILSPCVIIPKMLLQTLWLKKTSWDEPVSSAALETWKKFIKSLHSLTELHIPRLTLCNAPNNIEIHVFSDASQVAYGACAYLRSSNLAGELNVSLLCAKSKVAPIKPTTIPRLELCAALLAAKLCNAVTSSMRLEAHRVIYWCDSSVVLSWLKGNSTKLKPFVANRVTEISELTHYATWRYVSTDQNPADLISRGMSPDEIINCNKWWTGPHFLKQPESKWPKLHKLIDETELPEIKSMSGICEQSKGDILEFERFSSLTKLRRTLAYVNRFVHNARHIHPKDKFSGGFTLNELNSAFIGLCKIAQQSTFALEYDLLLKSKSLSSKSRLLPLSPFLDDERVMRVGGRLELSDYNYDKKHPILLHSSHPLTRLFFKYEHFNNMHAGPQLLLACVRETVWPINGRHLARQTVHNCVKCRRLRGKTLSPMMGNLPTQRITPDFPFRTVGIDFTGAFLTLNKKGRGARITKTYLAVFVCFRYKCVHLEAVSDLSKDAFIMALRRFISRRGKPSEIFCDNGRNFVAAAKEIGNFITTNRDSVVEFATNEGIKFIFSPTYAPHFGGIWEAGVKSAKYHLKRVMGNHHLTFEEICTLFTQVEAVLNSRPLCPLSPSPNDYHFLTPGHFLIGRGLNALPGPSLEGCNTNNLQRYRRIEQIYQHFWQRWQREYVAELQERTKWRKHSKTVNLGDLVLLQEDNVPPLSWRLGRISRLFPGQDGITRVVDVETTRGRFRRPLTRISPLPTPDDNDY